MASATQAVTIRDYATLIRANRNFRRLWQAQIVSEMGDWLYSVVIYSLLLDLTGKAEAIATAVVLQVLPHVLVAPTAGTVNDRLSRRTVMIIADIARCFVILAMLIATHLQSVWMIYSLLLLETMLWGFFEPGRSALLPNLVEGERTLLVANALSSTTWSFNLAAGSALGGLLAVVLGRDAVLGINAASFLVSALLLSRMRMVEPHVEGKPPLRPRDLIDFTPVLEGFRYIAGDTRLLATLLAKFGLGLMGANYVILALYGERVFPVHWANNTAREAGTLGMSILMAARGVGALLGPLVGTSWAGSRPARLRTGILYGFFVLAGGYAIISTAPNIFVALAGVVLAHSGGSTIWVFSTTMLQSQAEDRFRGRVFSADYAFLVIAMSASSYAAGAAIDVSVPIRTVAAAVGIIALVPAVAWAVIAMPLWRNARTASDD